jgi:hypothetical protein
MSDSPEIPGTGAIMAIFAGFVGLAMVAILISQKANTAKVIQSIASGASSVIGAATAPVTGGGSSNGSGSGQ